MNSGLRYRPFDTLLKSIVDNRGKTCPTADKGIPLIATNCIKNENLYPVFEKIRYVSSDVFNKWFRGHPKPGDLIFVTKGSPGRVCWVPNSVGFCIAQDMVAIRADENQVYPKYLFAALRSPNIQFEIENLHVGSLIPHFKKGDFKSLQIPLHNERVQKYIGDLYFNFSLKIDLLQRQNRTLEQLAGTLFRQWFIEEAKDEWNTKRISDVAYINKSSIDSTYSFHEIEYLDTGSITDGAIERYLRYKLEVAPSRAQRRVKNNDIVLSLVRPIQRHYGILKNVKPNMIVSTGFAVISCHAIDPHFLYLFLTQKEMTEYLDMLAEGSTSTYPSLKPSDIEELEFRLPPENIIKKFSIIATQFWNKIENNYSQITTLSTLRDTLLPKLMSGEVRVKWFDDKPPLHLEQTVPQPIYSIGHSNLSINQFIALLKKHKIDVLADVRSAPFSRLHPQFNRAALEKSLKAANIKYVFLGQELGARPNDPTVYLDETVQYSFLAGRPYFRDGIERLMKGRKDYKIAMMCAEKEPLNCHRTILVARYLKKLKVPVQHILSDGSLEDNQKTEERLLGLEGFIPTIFDSDAEKEKLIENAYEKRSVEIAFTKKPKVESK
jgi:type I restriction enzyme S subunit